MQQQSAQVAAMTQAVGWDTKTAFDPCSLPDDIGRNPDGSLVDGRLVPWPKRAYCNPPFSQTQEWLRKIKEEVKQGKEVVALISADYYFRSGAVRKPMIFGMKHLKLQ